MDADFKALCSMKGKTVADYLFSFVESEIQKNEEALKFFREGMSKLKWHEEKKQRTLIDL